MVHTSFSYSMDKYSVSANNPPSYLLELSDGTHLEKDGAVIENIVEKSSFFREAVFGDNSTSTKEKLSSLELNRLREMGAKKEPVKLPFINKSMYGNIVFDNLIEDLENNLKESKEELSGFDKQFFTKFDSEIFNDRKTLKEAKRIVIDRIAKKRYSASDVIWLSPTEQFIANTSVWTNLKVEDLATGKVHHLGTKGEIQTISFTENGNSLAIGESNKKINIHDTLSGKLQQELAVDSDKISQLKTIFLSPFGKYLAILGIKNSSQKGYVLQLDSNKAIIDDIRSDNNSDGLISFDKSEKQLVYINGKEIVWYDLVKKNSFRKISPFGSKVPKSVKFCKDERVIVQGMDGWLQVDTPQGASGSVYEDVIGFTDVGTDLYYLDKDYDLHKYGNWSQAKTDQNIHWAMLRGNFAIGSIAKKDGDIRTVAYDLMRKKMVKMPYITNNNGAVTSTGINYICSEKTLYSIPLISAINQCNSPSQLALITALFHLQNKNTPIDLKKGEMQKKIFDSLNSEQKTELIDYFKLN